MTLENLSQRDKDLIVTIIEGLNFKGHLPMSPEHESFLSDGEKLLNLDDYTDEDIFEGLKCIPVLYPILDFTFHAISKIDSDDHQEFEFRKTIESGFEASSGLIDIIKATCNSDQVVKVSKDNEEEFEEVVYEMLKNVIKAKKNNTLTAKSGAELKVILDYLKTHPESSSTFFDKLMQEDPFMIPELLGFLKALSEMIHNDVIDSESAGAYIISLFNTILSVLTFRTMNGDYDFINTGYKNFENLQTTFPKTFLLFFKGITQMFNKDMVNTISEGTDIHDIVILAQDIIDDNNLLDSSNKKYFSVFLSTMIREYLLSFSKDEGVVFIENLTKILNLDLENDLTEENRKQLRHKAHAMENLFMDLFSTNDLSEYVPENLEEVLNEEFGTQSPTGDPKETNADSLEKLIKTSMGPNRTDSDEKEQMFKDLL